MTEGPRIDTVWCVLAATGIDASAALAAAAGLLLAGALALIARQRTRAARR